MGGFNKLIKFEMFTIRRLWPRLACVVGGVSVCYSDGSNESFVGLKRREQSKMRLRRANTNLSTFDSVLMGYEYRLRETASMEKIFKYFASVVHEGEEFMTPLDLGELYRSLSDTYLYGIGSTCD